MSVSAKVKIERLPQSDATTEPTPGFEADLVTPKQARITKAPVFRRRTITVGQPQEQAVGKSQ